MRTTPTNLCFAIALTLIALPDAQAQQSGSRRAPRASERVARAAWQPVRNVAASDEDQYGNAAFRAKNASNQQGNSVRQAAGTETLPAPTPIPDSLPGQSVVASPVRPMPLDGRIVQGDTVYHTPGPAVYGGGGIPCDAMPGPGCGCDSPVCTGDCGVPAPACCPGSPCCTDGCSTCGEYCSPEAWRPCITLRFPQDGWISMEYLGWFQDGMRLPPLVTTSTDPDVDREDAGVLGEPSTRILYGGERVLDDGFDGARLRFGFWLNRCHTWGVGAEFFGFDRQSDPFRATSSGDPILARPFFNTQLDGGADQDSELVAFPGVLSGTVTASASSEFEGAGIHFRRLRCCEEGCRRFLFCNCPEHYCVRTELMFGYRYLQLSERVVVTEDLVSTDTANPGSFDIIDSFDTLNQFNGLDFGLTYRRVRGYWTLDGLVRLAVGTTRQRIRILGLTRVNDPTNPPEETFAGGLLTQTTNIGTYTNDEFTIVPEFNINLGYQLSDQWRVYLGYTGIYWSNVARPGDQISLDVNENLLPPPADPLTGANRPAFRLDNVDYWVQGINLGLEYRW